jgi:GTPase
MFYDRAKIFVQGGRGGDGCVSFRREAHVPRGGPDGGDGGRGGDVVLESDASWRDLASLHRSRHFRAGRGGHGQGKQRHGARGSEQVVAVPPGTQVEGLDGTRYDLVEPGQRAVVAAGGVGGHGNKRFATSTRQAPRFAERGLEGEAGWIELRLKLLADAGLIGQPNAGKSSLLRRISNAKPKVADYPFTTLAPILGTVDAPDGTRQLVVADVPGLIEGAAEGIGLGHEFLAHLERARALVHVIDAVAGDPAEQFHAVDRELGAYGHGLEELPQIVVLNKIDIAPDPVLDVDDERILAVFPLSCATGEGVELFRRSLFSLIPPPVEVAHGPEEAVADFLVYRPKPRRPPFRILRTDRGYRVVGRPPNEEELEEALRAAGAREGDEVAVGEETFEYQ